MKNKLSLTVLVLTFLASMLAIAKPGFEKKELNGKEVIELLEQQIGMGLDYGHSFDANGNSLGDCKAIFVVSPDKEYGEIIFVNQKTNIPGKIRFWFASGVDYSYTRTDKAYVNGKLQLDAETDFYLTHTYKPSNSDKYLITVNQDGDAGMDLQVMMDSKAVKTNTLCQIDF